jgi:hypothetical protein
MIVVRRLTTAFAALFAVTGSLAAQSAAQSAVAGDSIAPVASVQSEDQSTAAAPATTQPSLAPFAASATVGIHANTPGMRAPIAPPRRDHVSHSTALMIVGGAGLIVGALIGGTAGTIVMVAGGVCGLVGLYQYLQ